MAFICSRHFVFGFRREHDSGLLTLLPLSLLALCVCRMSYFQVLRDAVLWQAPPSKKSSGASQGKIYYCNQARNLIFHEICVPKFSALCRCARRGMSSVIGRAQFVVKANATVEEKGDNRLAAGKRLVTCD